MDKQVLRGKALWNASDKLTVTFAPDYQHQDQPSTAVTTLKVYPQTRPYSAELFNDSLNTPELRRPASHDLDAAIHFLPSSDAYELIAGGTNLTNDRYLTTGSINLGAGQMSGTFSGMCRCAPISAGSER